MKDELENELKQVEFQIINYMTETILTLKITDTEKITYKPKNKNHKAFTYDGPLIVQALPSVMYDL